VKNEDGSESLAVFIIITGTVKVTLPHSRSVRRRWC